MGKKRSQPSVLCVMQRAPCAAEIPHDDPNFKTTKEEQEERLDFIANYTDAMVRATVLGGSAARSFLLHSVANSHLVRNAKMSAECLLVAAQSSQDAIRPCADTSQHMLTQS